MSNSETSPWLAKRSEPIVLMSLPKQKLIEISVKFNVVVKNVPSFFKLGGEEYVQGCLLQSPSASC
jgi:hypothetical protein